jgi:hypothetical protein
MSNISQEVRGDCLLIWSEEDGKVSFSCEEHPAPKGRPSLVIYGEIRRSDYVDPEAAVESLKLEMAEALKRTLAGMTFAPSEEEDDDEW